jgi:hypothetical protein
MKTGITVFGIMLFLSYGAAHADALVQALPADGSWVQYHVNIKDDNVERPCTWNIKSVGKKMVEDVPCRWIELHGKADDLNVVFKLLIPEKEFGKGKNPLANAKKVWFKRGEEVPPKEISGIAEVDPIFAMILEGPTAEIKKRDKNEPIKWQSGEFDSEVYDGQNRQEFFGNKLEFTHTIWKHADVPFGVTAMKQLMILKVGAEPVTASIDMTLKDLGKDAKSELPLMD